MEDKFKLLLYAQHHRGIDRSNCHGHRTSNGYVVSWNEYEGILLFLNFPEQYLKQDILQFLRKAFSAYSYKSTLKSDWDFGDKEFDETEDFDLSKIISELNANNSFILLEFSQGTKNQCCFQTNTIIPCCYLQERLW